MVDKLLNNTKKVAAKILYDKGVRKILAHREVCSWIMSGTIDEFRGMDPKEIVPYIDGSSEILNDPENPEESNAKGINGMEKRESPSGEGDNWPDSLFFANSSNGRDHGHILVKVAGQKLSGPDYMAFSSEIFKDALLPLNQEEREIPEPYSNDISKVFSIWICVDAPDDVGNAISVYRMRREDIVPAIPDQAEEHDGFTAVLIALDFKTKSEYPLLNMLNTLLSPYLDAEEKKRILSEEFHIETEGTLGKEIEDMGFMSEYIIETTREATRREDSRNFAIRMLREGKYSHQEISKIADLSVEEVLAIEKELSSAQE